MESVPSKLSSNTSCHSEVLPSFPGFWLFTLSGSGRLFFPESVLSGTVPELAGGVGEEGLFTPLSSFDEHEKRAKLARPRKIADKEKYFVFINSKKLVSNNKTLK